MNEKLRKTLKGITIFCVITLILLGIFILYQIITREEERLEFDSINSFIKVEDGFIAVGSNNINDQGHELAKITRYNEEKEKEWETFFNNGYNGAFFDVAQDGDTFVAVGSVEADTEENEEGLRSALITRYDENGRLIFSEVFQILGNSRFNSVKVVETGYIVVGQSIFPNMTLGLSEEGGGIIVKFDREGNVLWQNNFGGSSSGLFNDFIIVDDVIYVVGKDAARVGLIMKYDLDGERITSTIYEYTDTLGFTGIIEEDGYLYIVGAKHVVDEDDNISSDALIVKYDLDLNFIQKQIYSGEGMERFNQLIVDENNNLVIVGHSAIVDEEESTKDLNVFAHRGILAKYRTDLTEILIEYYSQSRDDYFTDIIETKEHYVVVGYSKYERNSFFSRFIIFSKAGRVLDVR